MDFSWKHENMKVEDLFGEGPRGSILGHLKKHGLRQKKMQYEKNIILFFSAGLWVNFKLG